VEIKSVTVEEEEERHVFGRFGIAVKWPLYALVAY